MVLATLVPNTIIRAFDCLCPHSGGSCPCCGRISEEEESFFSLVSHLRDSRIRVLRVEAVKFSRSCEYCVTRMKSD